MTNKEAENQPNFVRREKSKFIFYCLNCRNEFTSPGYEVRFGRMFKYCSNPCQATSPTRRENASKALSLIDRKGDSNSNWKGGVSHKQSYQFRKLFCEMCGTNETTTKRGFIAHHLDMDRKNNVMENIKTVCYSCHRKIHARCYYGKYPSFQKW